MRNLWMRLFHGMITADQLIATEEEIRRLWEAGDLPYLIHLQGGNEKEIIEIFKDVKPTDWVFASHRCHYAYVLHKYIRYLAMPREVFTDRDCWEVASCDLIQRVKFGKSMFLYDECFVCSAIVAGTASIAAGMALAIKRRGGSERVFCFVGDGAEDSGHFYESVWFVQNRDLPCRFIIEDNDSSCGVTKLQRRGGHGLRPWPTCVHRYFYTPTWPHAGSNVRPQLKWQP